MVWYFNDGCYCCDLLFLYDPSATKEIQKAREALKAGDKVITAGGIYGKIKEIGDTYMLIEISDGVRIRVDKTSVFASVEDAQQK